MKKIIKIFISTLSLFCFASCSTHTVEPTPKVDDPSIKSSGVLTYEEFMDAELDDEVLIETYIQAKQSWWDDKATFYTEDMDGAYFVYQMSCTKEEYNKLIPGQKVRIDGFKSEWSGDVEIVDATFEILDGNYIAEAIDVTSLLESDEIIKYQNSFVKFSDMKVVSPATYKWDGSGKEGDDLYFNVIKDGKTYTFTVESFLCDSTTDVYKSVLSLKKGANIDCEGFLYWYNGVNPHITNVIVK